MRLESAQVRQLGRWGLLLLALALTLPGTLHYRYDTVLHHVNLVFHEAGHLLWAWGGEGVMLLGGSLTQLLVPLACAFAFLRQRDPYAAGLVTLWLAHSLAGVAAYVADAQARQLPLITGDPDTHDWWQLFTLWNALGVAPLVGKWLQVGAVGVLLVGILLALWNDFQGEGTVNRRR